MKIKANLLKYKDPNTGSYSPIPVVVSGEDIANKQDKVDNALNTTDKTIVGSINELSREIVNLKEDNNDSNLAPDWKNVQNKPFETVGGDTWTFDGDLTKDNVYHVGETEDEVNYLIQISDTITLEDLQKGGTITLIDTEGEQTITFDSESIVEDGEDYIVDLGELTLKVVENNGIPKGFYAMWMDAWTKICVTSVQINGYKGFTKEVIKPSAIPHEELKPDWKNVQNAPFKPSKDVLTWNEDTSNPSINIDLGEGTIIQYFHVSDIIPTNDDLNNGGLVYDSLGLINEWTMDYVTNEGGVIAISVTMLPDVIIVTDKNATYDLFSNTATFEKTGVYFVRYCIPMLSEEFTHTSKFKINGYSGFYSQMIPDSMISENIQRVNGDIILTYSGAVDGEPVQKKFRLYVNENGELGTTLITE